MSISKFLPLRAVFALVVVFSNIASPVRAAQKELPLDEWKNLFNVVEGLEINPKLITTPSGGDTTFGVEYKFQREIRPQGLGFISGETELGISLRSEGLIVAEVDKSPNHLISHGLRISAIDLLPAQWTKNTNALRENAALRNRVDKGYYQLWKADAEELIDLKPETDGPRIAALRRNMDRLANEGAEELKDYGTLKPDPAARLWWLKTGRGLRDWGSQVAGKVVKERLLFLNFDLDGNLEHDQALTNVQFVGSAQLRGKFLIPELDWPFKVLRFGGDIKDYHNRNGGPYFSGGVGFVDASENDARQTLTTDHEMFPRAHFSVFYRTELVSISESRSVAVELNWRYYHEFDAPQALRRKHLDSTSYFKATLLFPGNYFLEYTDGKLPLDVEGASTVSVGWRHNF